MSEVTDIPSLIRKYRIIIRKGKSETGHWAESIYAFLVSSVICETLTDDVTCCTINKVPVTLSIYLLYLCTQEMSSFHFQIITLKNSHFEFLSSMSQFWPVFGRMAHLWLCCRRQQRTIVYICGCVADDGSGLWFIYVTVSQTTAADYSLYLWLCCRGQKWT